MPMKVLNLSNNYCVEIDQVSKREWKAVVLQFRDATINQTWSFGEGLSGKGSLSHVVLKRDNDVVAAAQVRIETVPVLEAGIAYLGWGPMWQRWDTEGNIEDFQRIAAVLREEYVAKRGLHLTIRPNTWDSDSEADALASILTNEAFEWKQSSHRTLRLDLDPSLNDLRKQLHKGWRNRLNRAEKEGMVVRAGYDDVYFEKFKSIYQEMFARKQYPRDINIDTYASIQRNLPDTLKPRIVLCQSDGKLLAGTVLSTIGDTAIAMLGATSNSGTKCNASYLVEWGMIEWLKEQGYRTYDLGGADPENTPGTYQFKARVCGKNATIISRVGEFVACESTVSSAVVKCGYLGKRSAKWLKSKIQMTN